MQIASEYSHLNGKEYLIVHRPQLIEEIHLVIAGVDAEACRTKASRERGRHGQLLYSPPALNQAFANGFKPLGWQKRINSFWTANDSALLRRIHHLAPDEQKQRIIDAGLSPLQSKNEIDFVKDDVAVEVQFGKYSFVAHDLFVKHLHFFVSETINVGVEILPMKTMQQHMSSGPTYHEKDLLNVIRQGRGVPAVPLILIGIEP